MHVTDVADNSQEVHGAAERLKVDLREVHEVRGDAEFYNTYNNMEQTPKQIPSVRQDSSLYTHSCQRCQTQNVEYTCNARPQFYDQHS